jgi:SWI/SNF-related matrix-associated actin-dependent regulator of chromatin subfamily A member 5
MRELWSLLHWLYPDVFPVQTAIKFEEAFNLSKGQANKDFMGHARRLLELVMIRRMKNDPGINLNIPPKTEVLLYLPLTPFQRFWYQRVLTKLPNQTIQDLFGNSKQKEEAVLKEEKSEDKKMAKVDTDEPTNEFAIESRAMIQQAIAYEEKADKDDKDVGAYKRLQNLVMQLRKICIHPYQIKGASPEPYLLGDHLIHASSKFIILSKMIDELVIGQRKKVIIFSGFTMTLDYVEDLLLTKGSAGYQAPFHHVRFDGGTSRARRNLQVRLFNDPASDYRVMLISSRAGGLGLNLAAACSDIIFLDEDWNPQASLILTASLIFPN